VQSKKEVKTTSRQHTTSGLAQWRVVARPKKMCNFAVETARPKLS